MAEIAKGCTLIRYMIDKHPSEEYIGICEPCGTAVFNRKYDTCYKCGYFLLWVRAAVFKGQGVRSDYIEKLTGGSRDKEILKQIDREY